MRSSSVSVLWVVAVIVALASCSPPTDRRGGVEVMSLDLSIGADLEAVLAASPENLAALVDAMWEQRERSSFASRAGPIAAVIAAYQPDLVGLQSVVQWRRQTPASSAPADEVVSDHLELLLAALAARGIEYDAVAVVTSADVELTGASGNDYRLIDRDVILARRGVTVSDATGGTYAARRSVSIGAVSVEYLRGWASVHAEKEGKGFRFVSTNLEAIDPAVQRDQATELLLVLAADGAPTILVGDLASQVADPVRPAYGMIVSSGSAFYDAVNAAGASFPTCCRDAALVDPDARLDRRLDVVLTTKQFDPWWGSWTLGNTTGMSDGVWPSSHAGVVASLKLD